MSDKTNANIGFEKTNMGCCMRPVGVYAVRYCQNAGCNSDNLRTVLDLLVNETPLSAQYRDHTRTPSKDTI